MKTLHWTLPLPPGYRHADVIAFHGRDTEGVAEQVTPDGLRKGILQGGVPVMLEVDFTATQALCRAVIDGPVTDHMQDALHGVLKNILGLRIAPEPFALLVAGDPLIDRKSVV